MIYKLAPVVLSAPGAGYKRTRVYTVPSPQGRQPGVGHDGRLHMLGVFVTLVGGNVMPTLGFEYTTSDGTIVARFLDTTSLGAAVATNVCSAAWCAEPSSDGASGSGNSGDIGRAVSAGSQDNFKWLTAGMQVFGVVISANGSNVYTFQVMAEDYGQLAEGDDYTGTRDLREPPALLFPGEDT